MPRLLFERVVQIYRQIAFDPSGKQGSLTLADQQTCDDLRAVAEEAELTEETGLFPVADPIDLRIGERIDVQTGAPRHSFGFLFRDFDHFLQSTRSRLAEPQRYYIIADRFSRTDANVPGVYPAYLAVLRFVALLKECCSYLDEIRHEVIFIRDGKFVIPVIYDTVSLSKTSISEIDKLCNMFQADMHKDQKLAILSEAVIDMAETQSLDNRFKYLISNIRDLTKGVENGYALFASSFSYAKIRSDIEGARVEFINRIHKTISDIQSQLLGIPVATVIVASQMKVAKQCGPEFWTNVSVLCGAWAFVVLLSIGVVNQAMTLASISTEVNRQKGKLVSDYAAISDTLTGPFDDLRTRIRRHAAALSIIETVALVGAIGASIAYFKIDAVGFLACLQATP